MASCWSVGLLLHTLCLRESNILSLLLSNENSNIISGRGFSSKTKALFKLGTELCLDNMHALLAAACSYTFTLTHLHSGNLFILGIGR